VKQGEEQVSDGPASRFQARNAKLSSVPPTWNSVANTAVNIGLPTMPLNAEARAATVSPKPASSATFSFSFSQLVMSWMRKARGPSGPTLAPESSEQKDERIDPAKVEDALFAWAPSLINSVNPPWITVGARRYFWASPTSSEKNTTPTGMVHAWLVTNSLDQMAVLSQS
jgi:hypothetical protein